MTRLDRYLALEVGKALTLVMLVLLPLFSFLDLIHQLDDVGTGSYSFLGALRFELFMLPRRALDLLPFGALIGSTIGLVVLAHHGELIAMQASGISVARIALAIVKAGGLLMALAVVLDELAVSPLQQHALQQRSTAISGSQVLQHAQGIWMHYGRRFVTINDLLLGHIPANIDIFELDEQKRLRIYIHAAQADIRNPQQWRLKDLVVKRLEAGTLVTERRPEMRWESYLTAEDVGLLEIPAAAMSPSQLYRYVRYLQANGQPVDRYEMAFWRKVTLPLSTGAMVLLSLPFAFGSLRTTSSGKRIGLAVATGVAFQVVTQVTANLGLVLKLSPTVATLSPVVVVLGITLLLLRRAES